mmetsp:Transcript_81433/g.226832  ORF Transcript_81433/g.226832 Transcript_81433/m.226832 type:complete len:299 (-) Transcript_81433:241-1137(-)|eukprot:CAMPEP_0117539686 /NCGR_PEP_ID=MMETSP0784-20121206/43113_1 /TAXON_ID=39447 /ORGANISM="" /LENGTH=298 /DNA_ID=CAMNT_0005336321 /DNA_START=58 /DNA_END=954 /DNA_ORIENTATION=-
MAGFGKIVLPSAMRHLSAWICLVVSVDAKHILAIYTPGVGSHAFARAMDQHSCVSFRTDDVMQWDLQQLRGWFYETKVQDLSNCNCSSRGSLVQINHNGKKTVDSVLSLTDDEVREAAGSLCGLLQDGLVQPILLVRNSLMRWALSTYPDDSKPGHDGAALRKYDINLLHENALANVRLWEKHALILKELKAQCKVQPMVSMYESFEKHEGLPEHVSGYLLPCLRLPRAESVAQARRNGAGLVHHPQSHQISSFVANAEEVFEHFLTGPGAKLPSFMEVLANAGFKPSEIAIFGVSHP